MADVRHLKGIVNAVPIPVNRACGRSNRVGPMQHPELHTSASVDGVPAIINGVITAAGWVSYVQPLIYFGSFGALGGFTFWGARYGPAPSEKPRRPPIVHELLEPSSGIQ